MNTKVLEALQLANAASQREGQWATQGEIHSFTDEVGLRISTPKLTWELNKLVAEGAAERNVQGRPWPTMYRTVRAGATGGTDWLLGERYSSPKGTEGPRETPIPAGGGIITNVAGSAGRETVKHIIV